MIGFSETSCGAVLARPCRHQVQICRHDMFYYVFRVGTLTMEEWEIIPNPSDGTLDLSGLKRREFTEF